MLDEKWAEGGVGRENKKAGSGCNGAARPTTELGGFGGVSAVRGG